MIITFRPRLAQGYQRLRKECLLPAVLLPIPRRLNHSSKSTGQKDGSKQLLFPIKSTNDLDD